MTGDLQRFVLAAAFFAEKRLARERTISQEDGGVRPCFLPAAQTIERLPYIQFIEKEVKLLDHIGHQFLAGFLPNDKLFIVSSPTVL